ncbi:MAG: UDP-N-acetylmuramate:L-alanyl-gamma-D-glutamyl-meso-diaminopimelate ligase [Deltaproteobacteria bacterium]|nr:UDP-N-acetylmuramate:L-alanyl-gamma-D-glutamyl-meso-diaminopimelate ligase [Deltaproteobacteria bacterium]
MEVKRIHFVGIGGVGMGTFAVALANAGYEITGSDLKLYEPMKSVLSNNKVKVIEGYLPSTSTEISPGLVVVGNVTRRDNPEVKAWIQKGVKFVSFPEAVRTFLIQDKTSIVCAGTHGKTTTTAWISYLLKELGKNPSYLIGGVPRDLDSGCMLTNSDLFVVEGDEYDSAFFDKGPKFLHYAPHFLVLSSIEFDHADIYKDLDHVKNSFEKLVALLPGDGLCIARFDDPIVMHVASQSLCPIQTFGVGAGSMWRLGQVEENERGISFEVLYRNRSIGRFNTPMFGEHNLANLISGIVVAVNLGLPMDKIRSVVERFGGVKRRQEVLLENPVLVIDDFAHHPTEVSATLTAIRRRYSNRKVWAFFEPRSATARRNVHQQDYVKAFDSADVVCISSPFRSSELSEEHRFSSDLLAKDIEAKGKIAQSFNSASDILTFALPQIKENDVVVVMSNGEFDKIQEKIVAHLKK